MGRSIIQQPDGKWALFSSISDELIVQDMTEDELVYFCAQEKYEREKESVREVIEAVKSGRGHSHAWKDWKSALRAHRRTHRE